MASWKNSTKDFSNSFSSVWSSWSSRSWYHSLPQFLSLQRLHVLVSWQAVASGFLPSCTTVLVCKMREVKWLSTDSFHSCIYTYPCWSPDDEVQKSELWKERLAEKSIFTYTILLSLMFTIYRAHTSLPCLSFTVTYSPRTTIYTITCFVQTYLFNRFLSQAVQKAATILPCHFASFYLPLTVGIPVLFGFCSIVQYLCHLYVVWSQTTLFDGGRHFNETLQHHSSPHLLE